MNVNSQAGDKKMFCHTCYNIALNFCPYNDHTSLHCTTGLDSISFHTVASGPSSMLHADQGFQLAWGGDQGTTPELFLFGWGSNSSRVVRVTRECG